MATKKDLVEAYSFSRRRLVTAFVSGAPGGREVEPSRPGRTIVGGIALAVLMIAGAAVLGILTDRDPGDWEKVGLISEKETSADYVILTEGGPLRPISNITSAMLLLGPEIEATEVGRDVIAREGRRGEPIGILQAPETPPDTGDLVPTGWTACTSGDDGTELGVKVTVAEKPEVAPMRNAGLVVRSEGRLFLVAESVPEDGRGVPRGYVHEITQESPDQILRLVVPTSGNDAVPVPREWLDLFTPGAPLTLESLGLEADRLGKAPREPIEGAPRARVGNLLAFGDQTFLVTDGPAIELDEFALGVYQGLDKPAGLSLKPIETSSLPRSIEDTGNLDINWPTTMLSEPDAGDYCAQLDAVTGGDPGARIVTASGGEESAAEVGPGTVERFVESGHGAVVRVGDWDAEGEDPAALVDDRGFAYPLVGDAVTQLGYGGVDPVVVPDTWTGLFEPGVELSKDAASCPPTTSPRTSPCES